jgi:hypothetical protein
VEEAVYTWFKEIRYAGVPESGSTIQAKGKEFSRLMNTDDFQVSAGWLFCFWEC